ncbi:MAG: hypothetical protein C0404_07155 [Verrucomicrobia bacterium]|nr:hypothetical protein [Verrucomicrobiota bacterium]
MVKFDTSLIPSGSTVASASLKLFVTNVAIRTLASAPVEMHLLTQDWDQHAASWTRRTSTLNWSSYGGAFSAPTNASVEFSAMTNGTWVTFVLPAAIVQSWINTPAANYGILLKRSVDSDPGQAFWHNKVRFASSENPGASLRPKLEISFTPSGNLKPMSGITSPAWFSTAAPRNPLILTAAASDPDGSISRVDFISGGAVLASSSSSPFTFRWQHVPCSTNTSLIARAYDNAGSNTDSAPIPIRVQSTIYSANMDSNPGWTLDSGWQYGQPSGYYVQDNSTDDGDPSSGYTGTKVVGYLFNGTMPALASAVGATTPAINCTGYSNVVLKFYYWLGIGEAYNSFRAGVEVSTNGSTWQAVWSNPGERMTVCVWRPMLLNISSIASGAPALYIRWTMGPGNSYPFCGWNIDDVEVLGSPPAPAVADTDTNSLPDNWETRYFGTTGQSKTNDWDGDGMSNYEEYLAGTDPTNGNSFLKLQISMSNCPCVCFDAVEAGTNYYVCPRYYSLETRTNLVTQQWAGVPCMTNILAENQQVTCTNTLPSASFFRLKTWTK